MTLEERIQRLEDIQAIIKLKADYCNLCDGGWDRPTHADPEAIADLFTEDGVWDSGSFRPLAQGRQAIIDMMTSCAVIPFTSHNHVTPAIEVQGDTATGKWHGINMTTPPGQGGHWSIGIYDEDYRRTDAGWRFSRVKFTIAARTPFYKDWAETMTIFDHPGLHR